MTVTISAAGHKVLVQPVKVKNVSDGGIFLGSTEREDNAVGLGMVIEIGPTAFIGVAGCNPMDYPPSHPRYKMEPYQIWNPKLKVGCVVVYNRFEGYRPDVPEYKEWKVIPDIAIGCVVDGEFEVLKTDF